MTRAFDSMQRPVDRRRWLVWSAGAIGLGMAALEGRARAAEPASASEPSATDPRLLDPRLPDPRLPDPRPPEPRLLDELGVELIAVRLAASEFLIDLRYRVKDPAKAQSLLERKVRPVLVNETTGDRYYVPQVPKVGELRSATTKQPAIAGRVYFMLFANPDRKLRPGEKVTLYAGDSVVRDLAVQG